MINVKTRAEIPDKVYLDTNTFFSFLIKNVLEAFDKAKPIKNEDGFGFSNLQSIPPQEILTIVPVIYENNLYCIEILGKENMYNKFLSLKDKGVNYYTSALVLSEVIRKLKKEYNFIDSKALGLWMGVAKTFDFKLIQDNTLNMGKDLLNLCLKYPPKKNVQDIMHIILAKQNNCWFITGDKLDDNLEKIRKEYYGKIMSVKELFTLIDK